MKTVEFLEDSGLLSKGVTQTIEKKKQQQQKRRFLGMLLGVLSENL